jgi:hypothetical protein
VEDIDSEFAAAEQDPARRSAKCPTSFEAVSTRVDATRDEGAAARVVGSAIFE